MTTKKISHTSLLPPVHVVKNAVSPTPSPVNKTIYPALRTHLEPHFHHNFSQVKIHTDSQAIQKTKEFNAQALTVGQNIYSMKENLSHIPVKARKCSLTNWSIRPCRYQSISHPLQIPHPHLHANRLPDRLNLKHHP